MVASEKLRAAGILCGCVILASCREGVVDPRGPVGEAERVILGDATAIMLMVVIPVIILTLVSRNSPAEW